MKYNLFLSLFALHIATSLAQGGCDAECQDTFKEVFASESASFVAQDVSQVELYRTPSNASNAKPGDVLRWEAVTSETVGANFSVPGGSTLYRYLYMTEDVDRKPIPASAFVLLPYAKPDPNKPFNNVVWTHGTAGRSRVCAPSNGRNLYYEWQGPFALSQAGYAVIAPDYAGQGSDIPQGFMYEAGHLHAADAAYALVAARSVLGKMLSDEWVVIGHSEGGTTAWRTNERMAMPDQEGLLKAGKFLGAVAESPALRPLDLIPEEIRRAKDGPLGDVVAVYLLQSITKLYPKELPIENYVTNATLERIKLADRSCVVTGGALFSGQTTQQIFKNTSWTSHPAAQDWMKRYNGSPKTLAAPMLVVQGVDDPLTYASFTQKDFNTTCGMFPETKATLRLYPGADHDLVSHAAQGNWLEWIRARFAHEDVPTGCNTINVTPATNQFRKQVTVYSEQH